MGDPNQHLSPEEFRAKQRAFITEKAGLTKEEAAKILKECDLSRKSEFKESCQKYIDEILDIKEESSQEVVVNTILGTEKSAEIITEPQNKPKRIRNVKRK